jgi:pimeloyl-ACP methyl ester carboxylesterase
VNPELQHAAAKRMNATVTEVPSSHVPMLSQPEKVLDVVRAAAKAVHSGKRA